MSARIYSIYIITNTINNKQYVGWTVKTIEKRFKNHIYIAKCGSKTYLHNALLRYGPENFNIKLLEQVTNIRLAKKREKFYIQKYKTYEIGYNLTLGGDGTIGIKYTEERKKQMSDSRKGRQTGPGFPSRKGTKHSKESKKKMSKSHRGMKKPWVGERNRKTARTYEIIWPNGIKEIITNLNEFCKLYKLHTGSMSLVSRGLQSHHKGIQCQLLS